MYRKLVIKRDFENVWGYILLHLESLLGMWQAGQVGYEQEGCAKKEWRSKRRTTYRALSELVW